MIQKPELIKGGLSVDDRGTVSFVNEFKFEKVKRFYQIQNHSSGFIRAWHGHRHEAKYFYVTKGTFLVGCVQVDDWENPSKGLIVHRYVLSSQSPSVLYIPPGFANGLKSLSEDALLMVFSTSTLEDSIKDDIRFPSRYWDCWNIEER